MKLPDQSKRGVTPGSVEKAKASTRIDKFLAEFPGLPMSENGFIRLDRDEMYAHLLRRSGQAG
jgi:hypothetical protein